MSNDIYANNWRLWANYELRKNLPSMLRPVEVTLQESLLKLIRDESPEAIAEAMYEAIERSGWAVAVYRAASVVPHSELMKRLIKTGYVPCDARTGRLLPIEVAIVEDDLEAVRVLLDMGCPVNQLSQDGFSPVALALLGDNVEVANLLYSYGADVTLAAPGRSSAAKIAEDSHILELMREYPELKKACEAAMEQDAPE